MELEEQGIVIDEVGGLAVVRAEGSSRCGGCAASKYCSGGSGEEKTVEAENSIGARKGDRVVIALPSGDLLKASFKVYVLPVLGMLAGAAIAQGVVTALAGPSAGGVAAGIGGFSGAAFTVLWQWARRKSNTQEEALRPRVVRVV